MNIPQVTIKESCVEATATHKTNEESEPAGLMGTFGQMLAREVTGESEEATQADAAEDAVTADGEEISDNVAQETAGSETAPAEAQGADVEEAEAICASLLAGQAIPVPGALLKDATAEAAGVSSESAGAAVLKGTPFTDMNPHNAVEANQMAASDTSTNPNVIIKETHENPNGVPANFGFAKPDTIAAQLADFVDTAELTDETVELATQRTAIKAIGNNDVPVQPDAVNSEEKQIVEAGKAAMVRRADGQSGGDKQMLSFDTASSVSETAEADVLVEQTTLRTLTENTVRGVRYLVSRNEKSVIVRLVPESLGELHIEVSQTEQGLQVRLVSTNQAVREVLNAEMPELRQALAQEGLDISKSQVLAEMNPDEGRQGQKQEFMNASDGPTSRNAEREAHAPHETGFERNGDQRERVLYDGALNVLI